MSGIANTEWEYRKIDLADLPREKTDLDLLAKAGHEGWELIAITINNMAYLKRPIRATLKTKSIKRASVSFTALLHSCDHRATSIFFPIEKISRPTLSYNFVQNSPRPSAVGPSAA